MREEIKELFRTKPSQLKVVNLFLEHGFSVQKEGKDINVYAGDVRLQVSKISRAVGVDRKVVDEVLTTIVGNKSLHAVFKYIRPVADIAEVARQAKNSDVSDILAEVTGKGVMEIHAKSQSVGIAAKATKLLADQGLSIQFLLAKDPEISVESTMKIVTDKNIPAKVVDRLLNDDKITKVVLS